MRVFLIGLQKIPQRPCAQVPSRRQKYLPALRSCPVARAQAEILTGIALLPSGKRRTALALAAEAMFEQDFDRSCLVFDAAAAKNYALIVAARTRLGMPISTEDAQIAAITLANDLTLVTRNAKDFQSIEGLVQVNPWVSVAAH